MLLSARSGRWRKTWVFALARVRADGRADGLGRIAKDGGDDGALRGESGGGCIGPSICTATMRKAIHPKISNPKKRSGRPLAVGVIPATAIRESDVQSCPTSTACPAATGHRGR